MGVKFNEWNIVLFYFYAFLFVGVFTHWDTTACGVNSHIWQTAIYAVLSLRLLFDQLYVNNCCGFNCYRVFMFLSSIALTAGAAYEIYLVAVNIDTFNAIVPCIDLRIFYLAISGLCIATFIKDIIVLCFIGEEK